MTRLCYISRNYRGRMAAGFKAKQDNEDTVARMGGVNIGLPRTYKKGKVAGFLLDFAGIAKSAFAMKKGDVVFLQYPLKKYFKTVCRIARWKGAKTVAVIHDLGCFRRKRLTEEKEIARLNAADYIIASNERMGEWLRERGLKSRLGALGLFDYRSDSEHTFIPSADLPGKPVLVYAGTVNARKNGFLMKLAKRNMPFVVHVYGDCSALSDMEKSGCIVAKGFMKPEDFIANVKGDFGLVWDGDDTTSCTGDFGVYLSVNSPHKASFYLRAGLPLIVWRGAAIAPVVEQEGIGLTVDSLDDLEKLLGNLSSAQLSAMRQNVKRVSKQLADGHFLRTAIEKAISELARESE